MTEVHKVGVALVMSSNHAQVLGALATGLGLADKQTAKLIPAWAS
jgi:hypothetical protein